MDLEKAYDRVLREERWYCVQQSGVADKYVRVVLDTYSVKRTVQCMETGVTEEYVER